MRLIFIRTISLILSAILLAILVAGCQRSGDRTYEDIGFTSYRDIPDITDAEIAAIGRLREQYDYFLYAMPLSTEAFKDEYSRIRGFTSLFTKWLSDLFEIEFRPLIDDWLDILEGLETGRIAFTGELTTTPEREPN